MGMEKVNVICVKVGDRYSAEYVNRLYRMVKHNTTVPFSFYCYTDDPVDIISDVNIISKPDDDLELWWPKLRMFEKGFGGLKGWCVYFDLDTVIQNNIDVILNTRHNSLRMIKCFWKIVKTNQIDPKHKYDMDLNSSCLSWKADSLDHIWQHFWEDPEYYMTKYYGIDRFMCHEELIDPTNHWPRKMFYSRHYGFEEGDDMVFENWYFDPNYLVCMMNNFHRVDEELFNQYQPYKGLEEYINVDE